MTITHTAANPALHYLRPLHPAGVATATRMGIRSYQSSFPSPLNAAQPSFSGSLPNRHPGPPSQMHPDCCLRPLICGCTFHSLSILDMQLSASAASCLDTQSKSLRIMKQPKAALFNFPELFVTHHSTSLDGRG